MAKKIFFLLPFLVFSCTTPSNSLYYEKKLSIVRQKKSEFEKKITKLEKAIAKQEIDRIRKEVEIFKKKNKHLADFQQFEEERSKLVAIIQNNQDCALDAQGVLDQILSLITQEKGF